MVDYSSQKVPDLKKLLSERGLVISGNKADLIARLQEDDAKKNGGAAACMFITIYALHPPDARLTFVLENMLTIYI